MQYYLSYIERKGHAAMMLSVQKDPNAPIEVLYEFGFTPSEEDYHYFNLVDGILIEENNGSRALYSQSSHVKHRTYPISEVEFNKCLAKLNADRRKNIDSAKGSKKPKRTQGGGPNYQNLLFNCKGYALSMFKELGVMDAARLKNIAIQRPQTTDPLMKELTSEELSCPLKDNFIQTFDGDLRKLQDKLVLLKKMQDHVIFAEKNNGDLFFKNIDFVLQNVQSGFKYSEKIGIASADADEREKSVDRLTGDISFLAKRSTLGFKEGSGVTQESWETLLKDITALQKGLATQRDEMRVTMEGLKKEGRVDSAGNITFPVVWKKEPVVSQRVDLDSFSDCEKGMYLIRTKTVEMSACLEEMSSLCAQKMTELEGSSDIAALKNHVDSAINELQNSNKAFLESLSTEKTKKSEQEVLEAYLKQDIALNKVLDDLDKKIANFQPANPENTNWLSSTFRNFINLFKKDSTVLETDPKSVLQTRLSKLKKKSSINIKKKDKHDKKQELHSRKVTFVGDPQLENDGLNTVQPAEDPAVTPETPKSTVNSQIK